MHTLESSAVFSAVLQALIPSRGCVRMAQLGHPSILMMWILSTEAAKKTRFLI